MLTERMGPVILKIASSSAWNTWVPPVVAAAVSAIGVVLVGLISHKTSVRLANEAKASERNRATIDRLTKQLSEFYEPIIMLRRKSILLRRSLPATEDDDHTKWRTVRHIAEVRADAGMARVLGEIIKTSMKIESILLTKAGMLDGAAPESFSAYLRHTALIRLAFQQGDELVPNPTPGQIPVSNVPFPDEFDTDMERLRASVRSRLDALTAHE